MTIDNLYPPSVQGAPPNLTVPSPAYRRQVVIVLLSLIVFVLSYIGLIAGSVWMVFYGVVQATADTPEYQTRNSDNNWYFAVAIIAAVLFLFLIKSLFKWRRDKDEMRIEITQNDHPELFAFVCRICEDTKAPQPLKVFITHDVNA